MSALPSLPHRQPEPTPFANEGLSGMTEPSRRQIEARIARLRAAKQAARGGALPPTFVAAILDGRRAAMIAGTIVAELRCRRCKQPRMPEDFYVDPSGYRRPDCRECVRNRRAKSSRELIARRSQDPAWKAYQSDYARRKRERDRAAGIAPKPRPRTARTRLLACRHKARHTLRQVTDPARRAQIEAHILNLTAEIDRIDAAGS